MSLIAAILDPIRVAVVTTAARRRRLAARLSAAWPVQGSARRSGCCPQSLSGGSGQVGGHNVGRVPVEAAAGAVISHGGPGIGVRGGFLDVPERDPGV